MYNNFVECNQADFEAACRQAAATRGVTVTFREVEPYQAGGFNLLAEFGDGDNAEFTAQAGHQAGTWAAELWAE